MRARAFVHGILAGLAVQAVALVTWLATAPVPCPAFRDARFEPRAAQTAEEAEREVDVEMLAELAVSEDPEAVAAVTWTVLNRTRLSGLVPLGEVVRPGQFGTTRGGRWVSSWPRSRAWQRAHRGALARTRPIVAAVLAGRVPDPTNGATHFHRLGTWTPPYAPVPGWWRIEGVHAFYKARPAEPAARPEALRAPDGLPLAPGGPEGS